MKRLKIFNQQRATGNERLREKYKSDYLLTVLLVLLCVFGAIAVYSASYYTAERDYGDKYYFLKKQLFGYIIGFCAYAITSNFNYLKYKRYSIIIYVIAILLLALVLTPLGREIYGAKRWIGIGPLSIQPSEISKLAFVLLAAKYFSHDMTRAKSLKRCLPIIAAGLIICTLIMAEPNMSVTVCVGIIMVVMLFLAGMPLKSFLVIVLPVLIALPLLIIIEPYRLKRLIAFLDPWATPKGEGYQLLQSLYALGSGGLFGVGLFNSRQKLKFLPFAESDFILSVKGEELGFIGIMALLALCAFISYRVILIGLRSKDFFGFLLSLGIASTFIIQIIVNALVVTGSIPPTGLPFPLISIGNTQIIVFLSAFGIVNNVCKNSR